MQSRPRARERVRVVRIVEHRRVAGERAVGAEAELRPACAGDGVAVLEEERHVHAGRAVEPLGQRAHGLGAERQPVDLPRAVGRADGDFGALRAGAAKSSSPANASSSRTAVCTDVWPWSEQRRTVVALEKRLRPTRCVEEPGDRPVARRELPGGALRPERVRCVVVVRQVEEEEVEAVARDEPAADRGCVVVDRAGGAVPQRQRRARRVRLEQVVEEEALRAARGAGDAGSVARCSVRPR